MADPNELLLAPFRAAMATTEQDLTDRTPLNDDRAAAQLTRTVQGLYENEDLISSLKAHEQEAARCALLEAYATFQKRFPRRVSQLGSSFVCRKVDPPKPLSRAERALIKRIDPESDGKTLAEVAAIGFLREEIFLHFADLFVQL